MAKERSGIQLIAEMAKVSIGTVDRALHGRGGIKESPFGQKTRPGRGPEPEIIPLRTLMVNQAREVFCQRRFPASLINLR